jgi:uncharacterized protein
MFAASVLPRHDVFARLIIDGRDTGEVEVAASGPARRRGLLGRDAFDGAILLAPAASVHTIGMRFAIDVAFLDRRLRVLEIVTMAPGRLGRPRWRARAVLETAACQCTRWGVAPGSTVVLGGQDSERTT